tara:strand:+ start:261 stop:704 length:444 start_codon:yes stop_codon:yes gene_type:complete
MIKNVSLMHKEPFRCKCICNEKLIGETFNQTYHYFEINETPAKVVLEFEPFKIRPLLRLNKCLVDTGVAEVDVYDHKYEMTLKPDWLEMYTKNIIKSKQEYLKRENLGKDADPEKVKKWFEEYYFEQQERKFSYYKKELDQILSNLQ